MGVIQLFFSFALFFIPLQVIAGWSSPPTPVSEAIPGRTPSNVIVCCNNKGEAFAVWTDNNVNPNLQASFYDGTSWGSTTPISPSSSPFLEFQLCCNDSGNAFAIWQQVTGGQGQILVSKFANNTWTLMPPLSPLFPAGNADPQICCDDSGKAIAIWSQPIGTDVRMEASYYDGSTWTLAPAPISNAGENAAFPSLCCNNTGGIFNAFALWIAGGNIQTSHFDGVSWSPTPQILATGAEPVSNICCDDQGNAFAAWQLFSPRVYQATQYKAGAWTGINTTLSDPGGPFADIPDICCENGEANAIWIRQVGAVGPLQVEASHFDGANWTPPPGFLLSSSNVSSFSPHISCDETGNAIALWEQNSLVASANFDGSTWSPAQLISTPGQLAGLDDLCGNDSGRAVAVWVNRTLSIIDSAFFYPISPPTNFRGFLLTNRTATQSATLAVLSWTPSTNAAVVSYQIRRNGILIATVPANVASFRDCLINPCDRLIYTIISLDAFGNPSLSSTIVLN